MIIAKDYRSLLTPGLAGWRMAGSGGFKLSEAGIESYGGPGLLWFAEQEFGDFVLRVRWRLTNPHDNSGVFIRIPPLTDGVQPAILEGYEIQIDDRGVDPQTEEFDSALHLTGAVYGLSPAKANASGPIGTWNDFEIAAQGPLISVPSTTSRWPNCRTRRGGRAAISRYRPTTTAPWCSSRHWISASCRGLWHKKAAPVTGRLF
ncbi:MAG: DUF1080 domain-containing protein [Alphaproteobacteria bacterium]|nr:DUF1080 domain-containing protein [Alphaproteobacteria bacterium]